jgi:hypothetical protein
MRFTIDLPDELFQPNGPRSLTASTTDSAASQRTAPGDALSGGAAPSGARDSGLALAQEATSAGSAEELAASSASQPQTAGGVIASDGGKAPR